MQKQDQDIEIGRDRIYEIQFVSDPQDIFSSIAGSNTTILYVPAHGYETGELAVVVNHMTRDGKYSSANGTYAVTKVDDDHVSVPIAANGIGTKTGQLCSPDDLTNSTITAQIREYIGESAPLVHTFTGERRVAPYTHGIVDLSMTYAETATDAVKDRQGMRVQEQVVALNSLGQKINEYTNSLKIIGRVVQ
jgi:hypothetical protein